MKTTHAAKNASEELPRAQIGRDWKTYLFWVIPVAAVVVAGWFIYSDALRKGPTLHIYFSDAGQLQAGNSPVKYRGAEIGKVEAVKPTPDGKQVEVTVSLKKPERWLAKEHSQFWIVQARIGIGQIQGLGTIVSGDYITVQPGDGKPATTFQGLENPPVVPAPGAIQIVLIAEREGSLKPRTPVYYRGMQVGQVSHCELGPHSQTVQATVDIQQRYMPLVRMNSVFWNAGGINMDVGLNGADISAQSAKTLIAGGIDFATPDTRQKQAFPRTSFRLYAKPEQAWLGWAPAIDLAPQAPHGAKTKSLNIAGGAL